MRNDKILDFADIFANPLLHVLRRMDGMRIVKQKDIAVVVMLSTKWQNFGVQKFCVHLFVESVAHKQLSQSVETETKIKQLITSKRYF